jgi:protein phosphatase PTC7
MFGGRQYEDLPEHANITDAKFQHGDVLVLATDGVFDNLNNNDILKVVTRQMIATGAWTKTADQALGVGANLDALTRPGGLADFMPGSKHRSSTANDSPADPEKGDSAVEPRNREHTLQALIALAVAGEAKVASLNQRRDGPFAKESRRHWPWDPWRGGKPDDICVLVVIPVEEGRGSS